MLAVPLVLSNGAIESLARVDLIEQSLYDPCEKVAILVQPGKDAEQVLISEKALLQTLVQELGVSLHHIVNRSHTRLEPESELMKVGFKNLEDHIVDVVFAEVEHAVAQGEGLLLEALDAVLFRGLVVKPNFFKVTLDVFAVEQVTEDELVLSNGFVRQYQSQRPLHFVFQGESF